MFCKNCGRKIPDIAQWCSACGTPGDDSPSYCQSVSWCGCGGSSGWHAGIAFIIRHIGDEVKARSKDAWTLRGAHLLLQTRTKVLNNELEETFRRWYPLFRPQAHAA
jgi:hypothetical protein